MAPRRASAGLIPDLRARGGTFAKRTEGLKKMATQLSVLCDVDVALVLSAAAGGAAAADVWESGEGVLARYRARHAHRAYLEGNLGKEAATLARVRQGGPRGLRCTDGAALVGATEAEARRLLEALDAAIRAADRRRAALGMPPIDDGGGVLEGIAPLDFAAVVGGDGADDYLTYDGGDTDGQQVVWGNVGGGFQPCGAADTRPGGHGFQQCGTSSGAGTEGYYLQMAPAMYGGRNSYSGINSPPELSQAMGTGGGWQAFEQLHYFSDMEDAQLQLHL